MARSGHAMAWAAASLLGVLLTFAPAVAGTRTLSRRDTDRFFAPIRPLVVEALREGRLPLWNPHEATGKPLFAEGVHSVLHPVSLVGALLAPRSVDFLVLGYLALASLGAFALARALAASPPAAAGAALAFALSGFTVSMTGNLVFLAGLSTLPWLMAAARAAGAGWAHGPAATALATACAFFAGDAQVALLGLGLGAALAADAGGLRGAGRALTGMAAGLLLAGVQLAATFELLPDTMRGAALPPGEKVRWALAPGRLLEWLVPGLGRGPLDEVARGASGHPLPPDFAESVYLGAPLLAAAALGARRRPGLLLAAAAGLLLWLALGHHLGARQALDGLPLWGKFRYTEKLMGPLTLVAALLGALGVDAFAAGRLPARWRAALAGVGLAAAGALAALLVAPGATGALAEAFLGDAGAFHRANLAAGLPHAVAGLAALLLIDRLAPSRARAPALALLLAGAAAAATPSAAFLGDPAARLVPAPRLEADGPVPRLAQPIPGEPPARWGLPEGDAHARWLAVLRYPSANVGARLDTVDAYCAFSPRRFTALDVSLGLGGARFYRRFGLTHLVLPTALRPDDRELYEFTTEGGLPVERDEALGREVWAVPHRPFAFFAGRAVALGSPEEAHRLLLDLIDRRDDRTVVVEAPAPPATAAGRVLEVERRAERVRVEAEAGGEALLVVQDAWWPGWQASVDGRPVELLAADFLVRAVRFPPGRHQLLLTYEPPGVRVGGWISAVGALAALVLAALGWRARPGEAGGSSRAAGGGESSGSAS